MREKLILFVVAYIIDFNVLLETVIHLKELQSTEDEVTSWRKEHTGDFVMGIKLEVGCKESVLQR